MKLRKMPKLEVEEIAFVWFESQQKWRFFIDDGVTRWMFDNGYTSLSQAIDSAMNLIGASEEEFYCATDHGDFYLYARVRVEAKIEV